MAKKTALAITTPVEPLIREIRGERVILDTDLARVYGVPTFRFNEAVKRNLERFPADFRFQLTPDETAVLTSQIAMSKPGRGGRRTRAHPRIVLKKSGSLDTACKIGGVTVPPDR